MKNKEKAFKVWEETYEENPLLCIKKDLSSLGENVYFKVMSSIAEHLPKETLILESGCGTGRWVFFLNDSGHLALGIDFSRSAIYLAKRYSKYTKRADEFICGDIRYLPFRERSFDLILSLGIIMYFADEKPLIKEYHRCLREKGLIFLSVPNSYFVPRRIIKKYLQFKRKFSEPMLIERDLNIKYLTHILKEMNFKVIKKVHFGLGVREMNRIMFYFIKKLPVSLETRDRIKNKISVFNQDLLKKFGVLGYLVVGVLGEKLGD